MLFTKELGHLKVWVLSKWGFKVWNHSWNALLDSLIFVSSDGYERCEMDTSEGLNWRKTLFGDLLSFSLSGILHVL